MLDSFLERSHMDSLCTGNSCIAQPFPVSMHKTLLYCCRMNTQEKTEKASKSVQLEFDLDAYKERLTKARDAAGGITQFAQKMGIEYQKVQTWIRDGSIPRPADWGSVAKSGKGMAWFLFGIEGEMPNENNLDRKAVMAAIERLESTVKTLKMIVGEAAPDGKVERAYKLPKAQKDEPAAKTAKSKRNKK